MSLEAKIEVLSEQITQLTDAVTILKNVFIEHSQGKIIPQLSEMLPPEAIRTLEAGDGVESHPDVPNAKPSTTTDTSPPSSNESRTVTYDDVKNVTIAVSKIDKAKAVAGLARFGVTTAKALNETQWLDYVVYMEKVQSGKLDPEASHE